MKKLFTAILLCALPAFAAEETLWTRVRTAIDGNLGRPYVWGSTGLKSYDCSGFVWRVFTDSGLIMKRTTARKLFMSLPAAKGDARYRFGNLVFFDDLKHVGIVDSDKTFYHAESSIGTNRSRFEPYWRSKIFGFRSITE